MASQPIILYDIPGNAVKDIAWSPNTWKTRYSLNYKGIPYKTEWVEYPDIADLCKKIGATHTSVKPDGSPHYTLPAIFDPNTNSGLAESAAIVRYLDKTYPETPRLIPPETDAFHAAFDYLVFPLVCEKLLPLMLPPTVLQLSPKSEPYFRSTREASYGKLEEWSPPGPIREEHWKKAQAGLSTVAGFLKADGVDKTFFMGDTLCYADLSIAGWLVWVKRLLGADGKEWGDIMTWDEGRWARLMKALEKYEVVHV